VQTKDEKGNKILFGIRVLIHWEKLGTPIVLAIKARLQV